MADQREEIARLIDPPFWADLDDTLKWLESQGGKYEAGWPRFRFLKRELAHVMELYDRADAILARQGPGPVEAVAWRPEVVAFANLMEAQLRANDHKPGWKGEFADELFPRIQEEAEELREAIVHHNRQVSLGDVALFLPQSIAEVGREAADVANFAMMIADVCGALAATPTREAGNQGSSQGCGTGHSGEQLEPAVGATAALAPEPTAWRYEFSAHRQEDGFMDGASVWHVGYSATPPSFEVRNLTPLYARLSGSDHA